MALPLPCKFKFKLKSKPLLSCLFVILFLPCFSQSKNSVMDIDTLAFQCLSLSQNSPGEMIYLQTSKGIYETGEDLWFKAYMLGTHYFAPSPLSQTLYLQMVNEKTGKAVWQEKYEIQNGFANGHVFLQDTLTEGDYLLEAYTGHSFFNDSSEFNSIRKIIVKKDINPRPSFTATFNQPFYKTGDTIKLTLTALSEQKEPLYAEIEARLLQGDKKRGYALATTNRQGQANLALLPQVSNKGLRVEIRIKYSDKEEQLSFSVPCKRGSPIQFNTFPEGGNIIAGMHCNLAFKAVNIDGNPLEVAGTLFEDDKPLLEFISSHAGMGSLKFTPIAGKGYHIRLSLPAIDSTFLLPKVYPKGITMQLSGRDTEYLIINVSQSPGLKKQNVYLRGQLRGIAYCIAGGLLNEKLKIKIPLKEFSGQGIAEFTLFNENMTPVAERLVYIKPAKKMYIETILDKKKYKTRGKVVLKLKVTDENRQPVVANLGVSVYDKLYLNAGDPKTIMTHCCLSSRLKGKIYDPAYYFNDENNEREEALDLLMLTQGWRRYVWNEKNYKGHGTTNKQVVFDEIMGEVSIKNRGKKNVLGQQVIMVFNPNKNENKDFLIVDTTGQFVIAPKHLKTWQGGYIYLKPLASPELEPRVSLTYPFQTINRIRAAKEANYPQPNKTDTIKEMTARSFLIGSNVIELDEVTIKGKIVKPFRDKYIGHLDSLVKADLNSDYVDFHGSLNCFFHTDPKRHKHRKPIEGERLLVYQEYDLITGVFWKRKYIMYHYPKFTEEELLKMNNLSRIKAYYAHREFYQPNYDKKSESGFLPDTRNTLLWEPLVITDKNGEAIVKFYCSDINTGFIGRIEGVSGDGLLGSDSFEFTVLKTEPFRWEK